MTRRPDTSHFSPSSTPTAVTMCALTLLVTGLGSPVYAYTPRTFAGCTPITWATQPKVVVHTNEFAGPDFFENIANLLKLTDAINDVHEQFNLAGATAAQVTAFELSADPFVYQSWFGGDPAIHVGFTSDPTAQPGGTFWDVDASCNIVEAHIQFKDPYVFGWTFSDPSAHGEDYYDAALTNSDSDRYFRISYIHELLHAFGLAHSADSYSMLNYGDRPWAKRDVDEQIRPLPDDVEGLRALYPLAGVRREVAVLNTWYDVSSLSSGAYPAATQVRLCKPSLGTAWNADFFADVCGLTNNLPGSTVVAAGQTLRTRFTLANYSTEAVDVVASLYFSLDNVWDAADVASVTTRSFTVNANVSSRQGRTWTLPALRPGHYYVIARVEATTTAGVLRTDWIPLRGTVTVN
jgi:hypothetical protein